MADSDKILKELSNLSSNFDLLYKELKESTRSNIESSDQVRDLVSQIKDGNLPDGEDLKGIFEGFTKSFSKSLTEQNSQLLNGLTDKISQSFTGSVSDFLGNVPQQIAQVKSGEMPDFNSLLGGDTIKGIVSNAASMIPGLAEGGTIESNGIAVVGEKGPELVELKSGDKVRTPEEQLMEMMLLEEREKNEKLGRIRSSGSNERETTEIGKIGNTGRAGSIEEGIVENGKMENLRRFLPTEEEIEAYRKMLLESDPEFYSDPDELQEELNYFRSPEGYELETRETMTLEDINKLSSPVTREGMDNAEGNFKSSIPEIFGELPNLTNFINPLLKENSEFTLPKEASTISTPDRIEDSVGDEGSSKLKDLFGRAKEMAQEKLKEAQSKVTSSVSTSVSELKEKVPSLQPKNSAEEIRAQVEERVSEIKESMSKASGGNFPEAVNTSSKNAAGNSSARKKDVQSGINTNSVGNGLSSEDFKEMKSLLAAIYQTLRGPLTIANDVPFRPNSNNF